MDNSKLAKRTRIIGCIGTFYAEIMASLTSIRHGIPEVTRSTNDTICEGWTLAWETAWMTLLADSRWIGVLHSITGKCACPSDWENIAFEARNAIASIGCALVTRCCTFLANPLIFKLLVFQRRARAHTGIIFQIIALLARWTRELRRENKTK